MNHPADTNTVLEITYNYKSSFSPAYVSGSIRFWEQDQLVKWLQEHVANGPVLITSITEL